MPKYTKIVLILLAALSMWYIHCLPRKLFDNPHSAIILSSDGRLMGAHISSDGQWYFPPASSVPEKFQKCIICYEDKRFKWHCGVDFISAGRALVQNIRNRDVISGASTITMQVIRLSRPQSKRTLTEKLYEMVLATRLELRCPKRKIMLLYASNAPFGGNVIGLEAAAWRYFGRDEEELSWAENAMLAVLPNSPALIHPGRNRELLLKKRNALLDKLCLKGIIDETECALAKDEPLPDKPVAMPDMAYHLLERGRMESGASRIESTLDYDLQKRVNAIAADHFSAYHSNLVDNMGILIADINEGNILAYYGNTKACAHDVRCSDVDMIDAARSSGSTLKPILYAAMLDQGTIYPGTIIKDTPYNHNNFSPRNFSRKFEGAVPADDVIGRSLNVPSVRMLEQYGAGRFLELLRSMGFDTMPFDADHYGLSLILGGAEISVSNLAGAYWRMASKLSGSKIYDRFTYTVGDKSRKELSPQDIPIGEASIWLTFEALSKANRPEEEGAWAEYGSSGKIAWKTGTSWGNRDAWSVGVSGSHVVAVWVGNSDGEGRAQMTGVNYASPIMFEIFSALPPSTWYEMPLEGMHAVEVCHESGLPASRLCPHVDTIWVPDAGEEPEVCQYHKLVHLDNSRRYRVHSGCCPISEMVTDTFFVLPPAQEWYFKQSHPEYRALPPQHPLFDSSSEIRNPIEIIYPQQGGTIISTRDFNGDKKGAVFKAAHSNHDAVLYWHLDSIFLGETQGDNEILLAPAPGKHVLTIVDNDGFRRSVSFCAE